jgi:hypothetical protein
MRQSFKNFESGRIDSAMPTNEKRPRGRPPTGKWRVMLKLSPETDLILRTWALKLHLTKSDFVTQAILEKVERLKNKTNTK